MLSGIFKRRQSSLAVILVVLILTVIATSLASSHNARQVLDAIGGMYEEVSQLPDFTSLKLHGGTLEMDGALISAQAYPKCAYLFAEKEIITIQKRGDDVYFITRGLSDNYSGYVLSRDSLVDMQDFKGAERVLDPAVSGWHCYMFYSA